MNSALQAAAQNEKRPDMKIKKKRVSSELVYVAATVMIAFSVAMTAASDLGLSMIAAPAYILSEKIEALSFGQSECIIQGILLVVFCLLMKKVKLLFLESFAAAVVYGAVLDLWRAVIPAFNPALTAPGSFPMAVRILFFSAGIVLTALSVAMFFKSYLYPQIPDFFVKGVAGKYGLDRTKFKRCYDAAYLTVSLVMSLLFFRRLVGIGIGTLVITAVNGPIIGFFDRKLDELFEFVPTFPGLEEKFELD